MVGEAIMKLQLRSRAALETDARTGWGAGGRGGGPQAPNAARHNSVGAEQRGTINLFISL